MEKQNKQTINAGGLKSQKPIHYKDEHIDITFSSYTEAAKFFGKTVGAISKQMKKYGTINPQQTPTNELLSSGRLGKIYKTTREARQDIGITTEWSTFMTRVNSGVPVEIAKDDKIYFDNKNKQRKEKGVRFKDPINIDGVDFYYYGDIQKKYEHLGEIASPQTIRKRKRAGLSGEDLLVSRKHEPKRLDLIKG